jgi:hypothetical protein
MAKCAAAKTSKRFGHGAFAQACDSLVRSSRSERRCCQRALRTSESSLFPSRNRAATQGIEAMRRSATSRRDTSLKRHLRHVCRAHIACGSGVLPWTFELTQVMRSRRGSGPLAASHGSVREEQPNGAAQRRPHTGAGELLRGNPTNETVAQLARAHCQATALRRAPRRPSARISRYTGSARGARGATGARSSAHSRRSRSPLRTRPSRPPPFRHPTE